MKKRDLTAILLSIMVVLLLGAIIVSLPTMFSDSDGNCIHDFGEIDYIAEPSCMLEGMGTQRCTKCGITETINVSALGHNYVDSIVSPTCLDMGYTEHVCSNCNDFYRDTYVDTISHVYGDWTVSVSPTCISYGEERRVCKYCDEYETRSIEPHIDEHNWSSDIDSISPTCTEGGYDELYCLDCKIYKQYTYEPLGHNYEYQVVEPTCYTSGYEKYVCTRCNNTISYSIPPVEHVVPADWTVELEPTLNTTGIKVKRCELCGDGIEWEDIPAILNYVKLTDNTYMVSARDKDAIPQHLEIPSHYNGVPVTQIDEFAFASCDIITLVIPDTITYIGFGAFSGCWKITNVTISHGVRTICPEVFSGCSRLTSVYIPSSVTSMGDNVFYNSGLIDETVGGIRCGALSKPEGWADDWVGGPANIFWGAIS